MSDNLKPKEKEFVKKYVHENNENGSKTVKEVFGVTDDTYARVKATRLVAKDSVKEAIVEEKITLRKALEKKGITPEKIATKIDVLLEAERDEGKPDFQSIDKGISHATKIYGVAEQLPDTKGNTYNFIFTDSVQQKVRELDAEIKERLLNDPKN